MAGQLGLELELECSSDGSLSRHALLFSSCPDTVADIKARIQGDLSIPKSCQSLFLGGEEPLRDSERVAALYIRTGDTVRVLYLDKADVDEISGALERSLRPSHQVLRSKSSLEDARKLQQRTESHALLASCQSSLHDLAYKRLLPWNCTRTEANRRFMLQEGILDLVLEIYSILLPLPWDWRGHPLQNLEICCLTFLWNFSETRYARQLVADRGGFDMMLKSLMHQSNDEFLEKYTMHDIFDVAVGCISNFCELECCQLPMSENTPALQRLLNFALHGPSINLFTKMLIANLFFRLTHSRKTHQCLVKKSTLEQLLKFGSDTTNIAIRYVLGLAYTRLVLFSSHKIVDQECVQKIYHSMRHFLLQVKPSVVTQLEERYQYNWITMYPFVDALYTCSTGAATPSNLFLEKSHSSATFTGGKDSLPSHPSLSQCTALSVAYLLFALKVETAREVNAKLLVNQGLLEYITMLHWGLHDGWHAHCQWVHEEVRRVSTKLPVPRLSSIARAKLARTYQEHSGQIYM